MSNFEKELTAKATSDFINTLPLLLKGESSFSLMEADNSRLLSLGPVGLVLLQIKRAFGATSATPATSVAELRLTAARLESDISADWEDFTGTQFPGFDQIRCANQHTAIMLPTFGGMYPQASVMWNRGYEPLVTFRFDEEAWSTLKDDWREHEEMLKAFGN